jgi:hypothetical protein
MNGRQEQVILVKYQNKEQDFLIYLGCSSLKILLDIIKIAKTFQQPQNCGYCNTVTFYLRTLDIVHSHLFSIDLICTLKLPIITLHVCT